MAFRKIKGKALEVKLWHYWSLWQNFIDFSEGLVRLASLGSKQEVSGRIQLPIWKRHLKIIQLRLSLCVSSAWLLGEGETGTKSKKCQIYRYSTSERVISDNWVLCVPEEAPVLVQMLKKELVWHVVPTCVHLKGHLAWTWVYSNYCNSISLSWLSLGIQNQSMVTK